MINLWKVIIASYMKITRKWAALPMAFALLTGWALAETKQPNIIFIIADDLADIDVGAYGNPEVMTPNIDRLADGGALFSNTYNMGSWTPAVCVASRTMLNTGRMLWSAQRVDQPQWRQEGRFWSDMLREAGYRTYMAGKWHVRTDARQLFDVTRNIRGGMPGDRPEGYNRPLDGEEDPWNAADPKWGGFWAGGTHWSEVLADDAEIMIAEATQRDEPFFMYISFNAPHDPRQSPQEYLDKYPVKEIAIPPSYLPEYPYNAAIGSPRNLRDERLAPFPRTEHAVRVHRREFYAIISHMDTQIGRIFDALHASGKLDNTWIFFTADHGLAVGRHGLMGKQNMYEHSLRVPFIVSGPGVEPGTRIDAPIYYQDVVPTTIELAGMEVSEHVEFRSLLPLLRGEREGSYPAIYAAYTSRARAVIEDGYKLMVYPTVPKFRLFNLTEDPHEIHDLAEDPGQAERIGMLRARLKELQAKMDDRLSW